MNSRALKSPIRMVCAAPKRRHTKDRAPRRPNSRQAWGHLFGDPSRPWVNWSNCRWVCSRDVRVARFRCVSRPEKYAVLHPSTKPAGLGMMPTGKVVADRRVRRAGGWQFSMFDDLGASGDVWGSSCDDCLRRTFGRMGKDGAMRSILDARDWRLEAVVGHDGFDLRSDT